jgi:hypothetical protein
MKNKGQAEIMSIIGVVVSALFILVFVVFLLPDMIADLMAFLSTFSAEVVSRNVAGLITISAAAPDEITIDYSPSNDFYYDVDINNRVVHVKLLTEKFMMKGESTIKAGIDSTCSQGPPCQFSNVNYFRIEKNLVEAGREYGYECSVTGGASTS